MIIYDKQAVIMENDFQDTFIEILSKEHLYSYLDIGKISCSFLTKNRIEQALESLQCGVFLINSLSPILDEVVRPNRELLFNFYSVSDLSHDDLLKLSKAERGIKLNSTNIMRHYIPLRDPYRLYNY